MGINYKELSKGVLGKSSTFNNSNLNWYDNERLIDLQGEIIQILKDDVRKRGGELLPNGFKLSEFSFSIKRPFEFVSVYKELECDLLYTTARAEKDGVVEVYIRNTTVDRLTFAKTYSRVGLKPIIKLLLHYIVGSRSDKHENYIDFLSDEFIDFIKSKSTPYNVTGFMEGLEIPVYMSRTITDKNTTVGRLMNFLMEHVSDSSQMYKNRIMELLIYVYDSILKYENDEEVDYRFVKTHDLLSGNRNEVIVLGNLPVKKQFIVKTTGGCNLYVLEKEGVLFKGYFPILLQCEISGNIAYQEGVDKSTLFNMRHLISDIAKGLLNNNDRHGINGDLILAMYEVESNGKRLAQLFFENGVTLYKGYGFKK